MSGSRDRDSNDDEKNKAPNTESPVKDKVTKYGENEEAVRHEGPLSEGEDRDDYTNNENKFVDREAFDGKWAEKGGGGDNNKNEGDGESKDKGDKIPSESNIEEMDKFLSKVKKDKKEEMLERNKDLLKSKA